MGSLFPRHKLVRNHPPSSLIQTHSSIEDTLKCALQLQGEIHKDSMYWQCKDHLIRVLRKDDVALLARCVFIYLEIAQNEIEERKWKNISILKKNPLIYKKLYNKFSCWQELVS